MQSLAFNPVHQCRRNIYLATLSIAILFLAQVRMYAQASSSIGARSQTLLSLAPDANVPQTAHRDLKLSKEERERLKYEVSRIGTRGVGKGLNFYSIESERAMGRGLADEIEEQAKTVNDPLLDAYIDQLCRRLVNHSDAVVPFRVRILQNDEINAFALPGGYLYVNSGLLLSADSEAELAAVMAHEIAHVAARHASRNATKSQIWNLASIPLVFVNGPAGMAIQQIKGFAVPLTFLKFSRDAEREADLLGLQYQYAAGYDPDAFVSFFEKLNVKGRKQGFVAKAFATHPMNEERMRAAQHEIDTMLPPREQYVVSSSEFDDAKARLAQIISGRPAVDGQSDKPVLVRAATNLTADNADHN